jgi:hypothetical protein
LSGLRPNTASIFDNAIGEKGERQALPQGIIRFGGTERHIRFGADMRTHQRAGSAGQGRPKAAA